MRAKHVVAEPVDSGWSVEIWTRVDEGYGDGPPSIERKVDYIEVNNVRVSLLSGHTRSGRLAFETSSGTPSMSIDFSHAQSFNAKADEVVLNITTTPIGGPDATIGIEQI